MKPKGQARLINTLGENVTELSICTLPSVPDVVAWTPCRWIGANLQTEHRHDRQQVAKHHQRKVPPAAASLSPQLRAEACPPQLCAAPLPPQLGAEFLLVEAPPVALLLGDDFSS